MEEEELMESLRRRERAQWLEFRRKATFGAARSLDRCIFDRAEDSPQLDRLRRYAGRWPEMRRENVGLLLWGPMGTGKTFAAACVANALLEAGEEVRMVTLGQVLLRLFGLDGSDRLAWLEELAGCGLLILDDFGAQRRTDYAREQVYELVNRRYLSGLPMIVTTNLTLDELKGAGRDDGRIYERVLERCVPVCFDGPNLRRAQADRQLRRARALLEAD